MWKSEITGNIAKNGGALYCLPFVGNTLLYISESTFSGNYATQGGILSMQFFIKGLGRIILENSVFSYYP